MDTKVIGVLGFLPLVFVFFALPRIAFLFTPYPWFLLFPFLSLVALIVYRHLVVYTDKSLTYHSRIYMIL